MSVIYLLLYLVAALLFVFAAIPVVPQKVNLVALGLLAWVLVPLIHAAKAIH